MSRSLAAAQRPAAAACDNPGIRKGATGSFLARLRLSPAAIAAGTGGASGRTMIIFELGCAQGHRFEGWFASAEDFARQSDTGLVRCPVCDDEQVAIVPSARVRTGKAADPSPPVPAEKSQPATTEAAIGLPVELLRKLRETVRNTEDVGRRFPEEARKIHYEEIPARAIRGQASREEADALREEGIDFAALPPFLTQDAH